MLFIQNQPEINKVAQQLIQACKNTEKSMYDDNITVEKIDELADLEAELEDKYFELIYKLMPAKTVKEVKDHNEGLFKAKVMDKYILAYV